MTDRRNATLRGKASRLAARGEIGALFSLVLQVVGRRSGRLPVYGLHAAAGHLHADRLANRGQANDDLRLPSNLGENPPHALERSFHDTYFLTPYQILMDRRLLPDQLRTVHERSDRLDLRITNRRRGAIDAHDFDDIGGLHDLGERSKRRAREYVSWKQGKRDPLRTIGPRSHPLDERHVGSDTGLREKTVDLLLRSTASAISVPSGSIYTGWCRVIVSGTAPPCRSHEPRLCNACDHVRLPMATYVGIQDTGVRSMTVSDLSSSFVTPPSSAPSTMFPCHDPLGAQSRFPPGLSGDWAGGPSGARTESDHFRTSRVYRIRDGASGSRKVWGSGRKTGGSGTTLPR